MNSKKFTKIVEQLDAARDEKNQALNIHALLIKQENQTYLHNFRSKVEPSDVRSISKTILTLAFGRVIFLADAGKYSKINEESFVYPIIKEAINLRNADNLEKLKQVKIKHLLTHTIGFEDVLLMRDDILNIDAFDLLDYVVNYPIIQQPGEHYLYSNAGFYLLSVVLEEFLKEDLTTFLEREFFSSLDIEQFSWEKYGNYIVGATRLWLLPEDLVKFADLLLNQGKINDEAFISEEWIEKMLKINTYTKGLDCPDRTFRRYGYGYGIWLPNDSFYFGHGTDGQRLIVLPKEKISILTLAEQRDTEPMDEILNSVVESERQ